MDPNKRGNPPFEPSSYAAGLQRRVDRHTRWQRKAVAAARQMLDGTPEERAAGEAWWRGHFDQPEVVLSEADAQSPAGRADDEVARLTHVIDRDRYAAAIVLNNIKKVLAGYSWLSEAGRGPYAYDDERYQREFGDALEAIEAALTPLGKLAFDKTDCATDPNKVRAAREAGVERAAQLASDMEDDAPILWAREITARYFENDPIDRARKDIARLTREGRFDDQDACQIALYARADLLKGQS